MYSSLPEVCRVTIILPKGVLQFCVYSGGLHPGVCQSPNQSDIGEIVYTIFNQMTIKTISIIVNYRNAPGSILPAYRRQFRWIGDDVVPGFSETKASMVGSHLDRDRVSYVMRLD